MHFTSTGTSTNCIHLFATSSRERATKPALWTQEEGLTDFRTLSDTASCAQQLLLQKKIGPGDTVLLFDSLSSSLYGAIIGLLALGITIVFVEPWMPFDQLGRVIQAVQPKAFLTGPLGMLWGARASCVRQIPHWIWLRRALGAQKPKGLQIEAVDHEQRAIVTFTTGTTGNPKGVVRHHRGLIDQQQTLAKLLQAEHYPGADLCLFGNFALSNLASGRPSLIVPSRWSSQFFKKVQALNRSLQPQTATCGPAFLQKLLKSPLNSIEAFHIGGALSDCDLLEKGFERWPHAHWMHVYGSSEAEPVASIDAKKAVSLSRERGLFQTLALGRGIPEIAIQLEGDQTWVKGPYICPHYLSDEKANAENKRLVDGALWHRMGDRLSLDRSSIYWYEGRSELIHEQFLLEQQLMSLLQTSALLLARMDDEGHYYLLGEGVESRRLEIMQKIPQITHVKEATIYRDRRHRARLDRVATLKAAKIREWRLPESGLPEKK